MYLGVDKTYFIKELSIPNVNDAGEVSTNLTFDIDKYGRLLNKKALGNVLYADLDSELVDGNLPNTAPQKWLNYVNGTDYTKDGKTYTWQGLSYAEGSFKTSIIAYYVYYFWLENQISSLTPVGLKMIEAKNASGVNPTQLMVTIWNEFLKQYQSEVFADRPHFYYINGVPITDWIGNQRTDNYVSLLTFLEDNKTDYPDATMFRYEVKNQLGI
jgi:hypothetical protein